VEAPIGEIKGIKNIFYVSSLKKNVMLIGSITNKGFIIIFDAKRCLTLK
jgi:hypothetical protein